MKLKITKLSVYTYAKAVSFSPHYVRIFPRSGLFVHVEQVRFSSHPAADVQYRQDLFDNPIAYCFYPEETDRLPFSLELTLEVQERNPFHFLLAQNGLHIPPDYHPEEMAVLAPYLTPVGKDPLPVPLAPAGSRPTMDALLHFNAWIHEHIAYESRHTGEPYTPGETLKKGVGSCRDFAALLVEVLRQNGVAARLASGFVWEGDIPEQDKRASSSMHLWVEACLPGAGWIGLDPTNGVLTDHHFVTTAVGRRHEDVAPISGNYYSANDVEGHHTDTVTVEKID